MQNAILDFIKEKGFIEEPNEITTNPFYRYQLNNNKKNDKRFLFTTIEGVAYLGLCICNYDFKKDELEQIFEYIKDQKIRLYSFFCNFSNLTSFNFDSNTFSDLRYMNLSNNGDLSFVQFQNLPNLQQLILEKCKVLTQFNYTGNAKNITTINLANCNLNELTLPENLPNLMLLQIQYNQLTKFDFFQFIKNDIKLVLDRFIWEGNPLPETFTTVLQRNDIDLLKSFFVEKQTTIYRKKLILLGNTQAGKTSWCDVLITDAEQKKKLKASESTHGVNICRYELGENKFVQIYDFGGQDFYHNAHLPFYNMNTNYLLVYGNGQPDEYGCVAAKGKEQRDDDIFPMNYWLNSVKSNLKIKQEQSDFNESKAANESMLALFEAKGIKLSLLENLQDAQPRLLNQKDLVNNFGVSEFFSFQLRETDKKPSKDSKNIQDIFKKWLQKSLKEDTLPEKIKKWGDKLVAENWVAVTPKSEFKGITENDFKLLNDSYAIHLCEEKDGIALPEVLNDKVIVNLEVFTKWIYAILNLKLQREEKGIFDKAKAIKYLKEAREKDAVFVGAIENIDFILAFLKYYKMIFSIKDSENHLVPQYLPKPEEKDTTDVVLLQLFDKPFVEYVFEGFYHTQMLTAIIAAFFDQDNTNSKEINEGVQIAKKKIGEEYQYLIWKNKVILYLNKDEKLNPKDFLLVEFKIEKQEPKLLLKEMGQNSLKDVYKQVKEVIDFIEKQLENVAYKKLIKTPNGTYLDAKLLKQDNHQSNGNQTDLIYDPDHKYFYRKGDFPLFFDPTQYAMKKIFISYSKSDEKYKDEFKKHFYPLKRQSKIDTFDDSDLGFGEWNPQILKKIEECDIFVCLVSIDFLNTDYIINTEIPHALKNDKMIIPIKIRECDWGDFIIEGESADNGTIKLGQFNASLKAKPMTLFDDKNGYSDKRLNTPEERDAVWTKLVQQFKANLNL